MDIRQLKTFIEVVKLSSFSKAAEKLYLSQPTVSNHVQAIEKELGVILINRISKGITLTKAGIIVHNHSINLVNNYDSMKYQLEKYKGKIEGNLEIASSSVPRKHLLPELISNFKFIHPLVFFSVVDVDSGKVIERILEGFIDFGFVGAIYKNPNLQYIPIMEDYLVLATPPQIYSDRENIDNLSLKDILKLPLIIREEGSGTGKILHQALLNKGISKDNLHISARVADTESIKRMVSLGTGSTFLSYRDVYDSNGLKTFDSNIFTLKNLDLTRKFYLVFHKKRKLSPLGEAFKDFTLNYTKE